MAMFGQQIDHAAWVEVFAILASIIRMQDISFVLLAPIAQQAKHTHACLISPQDIGLTMHAFVSENIGKHIVAIAASPERVSPLIDDVDASVDAM